MAWANGLIADRGVPVTQIHGPGLTGYIDLDLGAAMLHDSQEWFAVLSNGEQIKP